MLARGSLPTYRPNGFSALAAATNSAKSRPRCPPNLAASSAADGAFAGAFHPDAAARVNNSAIAAGKLA
jgi:hypothetical protein